MTRKTFELDIPEGYEVLPDLTVFPLEHETTTGIPVIRILINVKKIEDPEYIEIREYLYKLKDGQISHGSVTKNIHNPQFVEKDSNFIGWIDKDWRKIYI